MTSSRTSRPNEWQGAIISRLLQESFIGAAEVRQQLSTCLVINESLHDGSFRFEITDYVKAAVVSRVPASIAGWDVDGYPIIINLHVVHGICYMVEIYKASGDPIICFPSSWFSTKEITNYAKRGA